ncbi:MAG: hypothetical protein EP346_05870 [Bacteroidetes bacterium]|uniref:YdhG-like domain-containing protein n=1 Tax=Phaeocystidibacter marisrubri TaxID=1577780 RepID=A0A6L3ZGE1_9FLAO|nr:DUF1801 domain-containing protein [Phaeocystidibacter marisrubri]KAB2816424.1 hypothetical protein F8C82_12140 [Phaeocystidibacter marisrubri]TNE29555.1 MAG: hypothetical protein EP346_05870 [Bacteroidota bacterium]GGH68995.1 hypothetical protein GCM10011318_09560 [Phaeocystidibacter marisrubri]
MSSASQKIDEYIEKKGEGWKGECLNHLRQILNSCDVEEAVKWGMPTYVNHGNVVGLAAFKNHVALWFFQGVFLQDEAGILTTSDGTSKAMRQIRFEEGDVIPDELLIAYIREAISNSIEGKSLPPEKKEELPLPKMLETALSADELLREKFYALTMTQRNEYAEHIGSAKREETAKRRLEKCLNYIREGLDLNHKYRK